MEKDPYRYFRIEAREILDLLSQGILTLEGDVSAESVTGLLRASHTLKGAAGVVGHEGIAKLAHRLEESLSAWARPGAPERTPADQLLALVDAIATELGKLGVPAATPGSSVPRSEPVNEPSKSAVESVRLDLLDVDKVLAKIADVRSSLVSTRLHCGGLARAEAGLRDVESRLADARGTETSPASLHLSDAIEMVETLRGSLRADREALEASLERAERRSWEMLEDARRLRLVPAETLFGELARAAHAAAATRSTEGPESRRGIEVETTGGEIRVDAPVLGLLRDALLQLVRNAIAHAIEPASERRRAGKPEAGQIAIRFELRGSRAVVTCRDDGRGIDVPGMRSALVSRGLASEEAASAMDAEALARMAMPRGVTTRTAASELAGRGVGLQVVGTMVDRLRGEVRVRTEAGRGTEFELEVPLTIAAAPALVVATGDVVMTIPLDSVTRTVRVPANQIASSPEGDSLSDGAEAVRFASLDRVLRLPSATATREDVSTAVLLAASGGRAAVGVDRILGVESEVVLGLPSCAVADAVVVGASFDGRGDPRLALDPRLLVEAVRTLPGAPRAAAGPVKRSVLVVDDSLTSRMLERSILEAAGYDVTTASSGEEALDIARQHAFALFVVDVEMPGMSGFEFVARTRSDAALSATPAVLVTSRAAAEDRRRGLEVGARAYIVKGEFAQDEFLDAVRRLVG
ncbi:MAG TPA: response regulator [Labilithrix sp.]|nr:response regulator [Labilithrix sp.]